MTQAGFVVVALTLVNARGDHPKALYLCEPFGDEHRFSDGWHIARGRESGDTSRRDICVFATEAEARAAVEALTAKDREKLTGWVMGAEAEFHVAPIYPTRVAPRTPEEQAEKDRRDATAAAWKAYYEAHPDAAITTSMPRRHTSEAQA